MEIETKKPDWLPDFVLFEDYDNDWDKYLEAIYSFYKTDFIKSIKSKPIFNFSPLYNSLPVSRQIHPITESKDFTIWHIIQEEKMK